MHSLNTVIIMYKKTLWQYSSDERDHDMADSKPFNIKSRLAYNAGKNGIANVKVAKPSKYLSNSWKTLEMPLINYEISIDLTCSAIFVICIADGETTFAIVDTKLYGSEGSL